MPHPIITVKHKRPCHGKLGGHLQQHRPRSEGSREHSGFDVPAEVGRDEIEGAVDVEDTADGAAGDAVQSGEVPGYLRTVDGEVGGYGAV